MPRKFRRVLHKGYSVRKPVKTEPANDSAESSEDEAHSVATAVQATCEVATQTEMSAFTTLLYNADNQNNKFQALSSVEPTVSLTVCEGNNDEKFRPLIEKHKGIFRDASGICMVIFLLMLINVCM